jgi:hypothetical protein
MTNVQVRDRLSRHLGQYGELVSKNATGSYTVQLDCGYRTFQNYQLRMLASNIDGDLVEVQLP